MANTVALAILMLASSALTTKAVLGADTEQPPTGGLEMPGGELGAAQNEKENEQKKGNNQEKEKKEEEEEKNEKSADMTRFLNRSHWGVGLAVMHTDEQVIDDARIVNGVVRVTDGQHTQPSIILERHWFFSTPDTRAKKPPGARRCTLTWWEESFCTGLFVAVGVGSTDQVIDLVGLGFIFGFGLPTDLTRQQQQHNIGLGLAGAKFNSRVLGEGIREDAPLPAGETEIRYDRESDFAWFIFYSYTLPTQREGG